MFCADPDVPTITSVSDITQTSVNVLWSVGDTNVVHATVVRYRVKGTSQWTNISVTEGTSHVVSPLQPGKEYQFSVVITSYGKSSSSLNTDTFTGKVTAIFGFYFVVYTTAS